MNKVFLRCKKESCAKFYYSSHAMLTESKTLKLVAYFISIIPIALSLLPIPGDKTTLVFATTMISFGLTLFLEFISTFLSNHKEQSILLGQLYEAEISGTTFSKIEYDREMTNELNELAIRKSANKMSKTSDYHTENVPEEIEDRYSYLYLCRTKSASTYYLMSRMFSIYVAILCLLITLFICIAFVKNNTFQFLQLIIQFYPLILPIIRNITSSRKTMKYCAKLSADIDNFLADGDDSNMRLARFIYYVQNIEFEMLMASPARYVVFYKLFSKGLKNLEKGVTKRFISAERGMYKLTGKPLPKLLAPKSSKTESQKTKKTNEAKVEQKTTKKIDKPKAEQKASKETEKTKPVTKQTKTPTKKTATPTKKTATQTKKVQSPAKKSTAKSKK